MSGLAVRGRTRFIQRLYPIIHRYQVLNWAARPVTHSSVVGPKSWSIEIPPLPPASLPSEPPQLVPQHGNHDQQAVTQGKLGCTLQGRRRQGFPPVEPPAAGARYALQIHLIIHDSQAPCFSSFTCDTANRGTKHVAGRGGLAFLLTSLSSSDVCCVDA